MGASAAAGPPTLLVWASWLSSDTGCLNPRLACPPANHAVSPQGAACAICLRAAPPRHDRRRSAQRTRRGRPDGAASTKAKSLAIWGWVDRVQASPACPPPRLGRTRPVRRPPRSGWTQPERRRFLRDLERGGVRQSHVIGHCVADLEQGAMECSTG